MTVPWTLAASTAIGIWLMAAPAALATGGTAADSDHLVGALVVCVSVIAMAEVGRIGRFVNVLFGAWLVVSPFIVDGGTGASVASDIAAGVALNLLALPRGPVRERYATAMRFIK